MLRVDAAYVQDTIVEKSTTSESLELPTDYKEIIRGTGYFAGYAGILLWEGLTKAG